MALINCPECGKQVSDRAIACPDCGCPIASTAAVANEAATPVAQKSEVVLKKKKKATLIIAISVMVVLFLVSTTAVYLYVTAYSPKAVQAQAEVAQYQEYCDTVELYNDGAYAEALVRFEEMQNYENSVEIARWCKYELGKAAMVAFDWETAALYFTDLSYGESDTMLTDCSFMLALEQSVLRRMEINAKESSDYRSLVSTELAYLEEYRNATFYDGKIKLQAGKYIKGLDTQLDSLTYDYYYEHQDGWHTGMVARFEVLDYLYRNYAFMTDNHDFVGAYINQLEYEQKWLTAFDAMETSGHADGNWKFTSSYVEICFKNNTRYTSSQTFDFVFWGDEAETKHLGTTSVYVQNIGPYSEYTVRAYYPEEAKNAYYSSGLWVHWASSYDEIRID